MSDQVIAFCCGPAEIGFGCPCCGGAYDSLDPETGEAGPFVGPNGLCTCSLECWEELAELAERSDAAWRNDWCAACGFDRGEHADDCVGHG